jgi:hypothetical protein
MNQDHTGAHREDVRPLLRPDMPRPLIDDFPCIVRVESDIRAAVVAARGAKRWTIVQE